MFSWYFKSNLLIRIIIGLVLGAIAGIIMGPEAKIFSPLGDILVRSLKMIVMPVIVSTIIVGAGSVKPSQLGKVGAKCMAFYMITTGFAVAIGLFFGNILQPGNGLQLAAEGATLKVAAPKATSFLDILINIIPKNPFAAITTGDVLSTIFFCIITGIAISILRHSEDGRIKNAGDSLFYLFEGLAEVMYLIINWVLQYVPIGVFALIAVVFGAQGSKAAGPLGVVVIATYLAFACHIFLVYGGGLLLFRVNPMTFFKKVKTASIAAFVTRSSSGVLPISMEVADKELGVDKSIYSFSLPLGATINMDGTAIYQGVCALFIGYAIGEPLTASQQITVIGTTVLASLGTAGIPGAGAIMLMIVLNSVGLEITAGSPTALAYAMIFGIDALLDMGRTCTNVTGDLAVTCAVANSENEINQECWETREATQQ
ncbi:dicarboxylate/amino acid:cation symporter [Desulfovibrio sp. JC010]|uniref:dicarboxylate/amino acid:cation symporter n=1 Tax=Desulfovibrio sp. JC010 TaxID=2593641 RepID=UPI0013D02866|nr:dicarboxylate/amino acid:cation symporter [Desulfovibrio sp. JC010]NDV25601.1 dicarboxylate/amino acid:cation symporter [Desulfovibrio sp. JC010]